MRTSRLTWLSCTDDPYDPWIPAPNQGFNPNGIKGWHFLRKGGFDKKTMMKFRVGFHRGSFFNFFGIKIADESTEVVAEENMETSAEDNVKAIMKLFTAIIAEVWNLISKELKEEGFRKTEDGSEFLKRYGSSVF